MALVKLIDEKMNPVSPTGDVPTEPWLLLLDCCPHHISAEFREHLAIRYAHVQAAYIEGGKTADTQPLDVAVMRPWKCSLRGAATEDLSEMILGDLDSEQDLAARVNRRTMKQKILPWVQKACDDVRNREAMYGKAWWHLHVPEAERAHVLEKRRL